MKNKKYWLKYVNMYSKEPKIIKEESENFEKIYNFYKLLLDIEVRLGISAYYIHSMSKSLKDKIEMIENL